MPWPFTRKPSPIFFWSQFFFWRFRENIKFWFTKRLLTIVILARIVFGLNKKTIWIPQEGDASLVVFFSVLANENWKWPLEHAIFIDYLRQVNQIPYLLFINKFFSSFSNFNDLTKFCLSCESTRLCWSYDWKHVKMCWCSHGVWVWSWHSTVEC